MNIGISAIIWLTMSVGVKWKSSIETEKYNLKNLNDKILLTLVFK